MSQFKSEIRASVLNDLGSRIEDVLEAARKEFASFQGGKQALVLGRQKIEAHMGLVDKDVEAGRLDLQQASLVKKYMTQCSHILENLAIQVEVQGYQAQGKILATEGLVKMTKSLLDQEKAKIEATSVAEAAPTDAVEEDSRRPMQRQVGVHPGNVLADRKAESSSETPLEAPSAETSPLQETHASSKKRAKKTA